MTVRILIVDDEEINRYTVAAFMRKKCLTAQLEFAVNGRDAVRMFQTAIEEGAPYGLAIIDYYMPVMNGFEAVRSIRELESRTAIVPECTICISSADHTCENLFREWIDKSRNFCTLPKPINFNQLESIYSSLMQTGEP